MLTGTHPCDAPPRQGWWNIRAPARAVLVGLSWCVVHVVLECRVLTFVGFPHTPLLDMVTAVALSIFGGTSHHSWLIALAVTTDLHSTCQLDLLLTSPHCVRCTAGTSDLRLSSLLALAAGSLLVFAGGCCCDRHAESSSPCNMPTLITVNSNNISLGVLSSVVQFPLVLKLHVLLHPAINSGSPIETRQALSFRFG